MDLLNGIESAVQMMSGAGLETMLNFLSLSL
jgi:hypothetical protein